MLTQYTNTPKFLGVDLTEDIVDNFNNNIKSIEDKLLIYRRLRNQYDKYYIERNAKNFDNLNSEVIKYVNVLGGVKNLLKKAGKEFSDTFTKSSLEQAQTQMLENNSFLVAFLKKVNKRLKLNIDKDTIKNFNESNSTFINDSLPKYEEVINTKSGLLNKIKMIYILDFYRRTLDLINDAINSKLSTNPNFKIDYSVKMEIDEVRRDYLKYKEKYKEVLKKDNNFKYIINGIENRKTFENIVGIDCSSPDGVYQERYCDMIYIFNKIKNDPIQPLLFDLVNLYVQQNNENAMIAKGKIIGREQWYIFGRPDTDGGPGDPAIQRQYYTQITSVINRESELGCEVLKDMNNACKLK